MSRAKKILSHNVEAMLSARKVAVRLDCAPDYVTKLCREGRLEGIRVRNAWYVKESSIARFEKEREEARVVRSKELADARRQEQEIFALQQSTAFGRFLRDARKTVGGASFAAAFAVALCVGLTLAAVLPRNNNFFAQNTNNTAAVLTQIQSPFFGLQPPKVTYSWHDLVAYFFGNTEPVVAVQTTQAQPPVVQQTSPVDRKSVV